MIRGHVALVRQLRAFMENSNLPWQRVSWDYDTDEDGRTVYTDDRAEMHFPMHDSVARVAIFAPTADVDAGERLPLGRLACQYKGQVVKGPIDQRTWDQIVEMINRE